MIGKTLGIYTGKRAYTVDMESGRGTYRKVEVKPDI
jgi:hypothetical protein